MSGHWPDTPPSLGGANVSGALVADVLAAVLRARGTISRGDLEVGLGLKLSSVSKAVKFLVSKGFLTESGKEQLGLGRPVSLLRSDDRFRLVGLYLADVEHPASEVAESHLSGVVTTLGGKLVGPPAHTSVKVGLHQRPDRRAREVASDVADFVETRLLSGLAAEHVVVAVGLTLGGHIRNGDVIRSYNLAWDVDEPIPLQRRLQERLPWGVEVVVENDVKALADRAWWFGHWSQWLPQATEPPRTFLAVFVTPSGIGSGFYIDGRRYEGGSGINGEIGHDKFDRGPDAPLCRCGRHGCVETYAAPNRMLASLGKKDLKLAAAGPGERVRALFAQGGRALGAGVASFVNHVGPDAIVVFAPEEMADHWGATEEAPRTAGADYWAAFKQALAQETFPGGEGTPIAVVGLRGNGGPDLAIGAASTALNALMERLRNP